MERRDLMEALTSGAEALRQLVSGQANAGARLRVAAATALMSRRFDEAAHLFVALANLEPAHADHCLHLGYALAACGQRRHALEALSAYLEQPPLVSDELLVRTLLMRSQLHAQEGRRDLAAADVRAAEARAGDDAALLAMVKEYWALVDRP